MQPATFALIITIAAVLGGAALTLYRYAAGRALDDGLRQQADVLTLRFDTRSSDSDLAERRAA